MHASITWLRRLVTWDGMLPAVVWSVPFLLRLLMPHQRFVIEITAVCLPIAAFFVRYHVGRHFITDNGCRTMVRRMQMVALSIGLVVLVLIDGVMILTHVMPRGAAFAATGDVIVWAALYSTYMIAMAVALYPGHGGVCVSAATAASYKAGYPVARGSRNIRPEVRDA